MIYNTAVVLVPFFVETLNNKQRRLMTNGMPQYYCAAPTLNISNLEYFTHFDTRRYNRCRYLYVSSIRFVFC